MPPTSEQDEQPAPGAEADNTPPSRTLRLVLSVEWVSPSIARDRVRRWLRAHQWSPAHIDELVLAISEAVSNSIEHGYGILPDQTEQLATHPGVVELEARVVSGEDGKRAEFTITDTGDWIDRTAGRGSRGHGLTIIRACAEEARISGGRGGTTVFLRSRPVPTLL